MGESRGYTEVKTPQLYDAQLWKTSGHWDKYRDNMFVTESEGKQLALKPMNCPGHCQLYKLQKFSYRDLPIRYSEPGLLHRNELSGALHGLMRVRHFAQDDAHVFCTEDQIQQEVTACLEFAFATYKLFGFDVEVELSTRPEQRIGSDELWDHSEGALRRRWRPTSSTTASTRATAPSTARRSTCTCATRSAARGSSAPSSSTTTSRSASSSPTPAPTTPSTGR